MHPLGAGYGMPGAHIYHLQVHSNITLQAATPIYIREDLKDRLNSLKRHPKESYNDIFERLVNLAVDEESLSEDAGQRSQRSS